MNRFWRGWSATGALPAFAVFPVFAVFAVFALALFAVAGGVPTAASADAVPAAAGARTWQVVYQRTSVQIESVAATGPDDAWAIGLIEGQQGPTGGLLLHWNGRRWGQVRYPDSDRFLPMAIYPISASDIWLAQYDNSAPTSMLHLKNGKWSTLTLPVNSNPILVLGDRDIWVAQQGDGFGACPVSAGQYCVTTARWNGSTWSDYRLGASGLLTAAASSPSDIWVAGDIDNNGNGTTFRAALFRWSGSSWRHVALTGTRMTWTPPIVAYSPDDLYVDEATTAHPRACAMHWNGHSWDPVYLAHSSGACGQFTTDYRRGLWVNAPPIDGYGFNFAHWTGTRFVLAPSFVPTSSSSPGAGWSGSASVSAVPRSSNVWLFGSFCVIRVSTCGPYKGTIAILR